MTVINDTRVVRLQRTAARTGHQHSGNEDFREEVTDELVTSADIVALPPGSLITLQRGPAAGLTEEGSVLNATRDDIGGVEGGQTSSVTFDSEDAGVTAASIFATEIDFTLSPSAPGEYAVNYKTFQVKTFTPVPTTVGSRILISYGWAPIREYLEFLPEDLDPDLVAFGPFTGPHQSGGGGASVVEGSNINITINDDGYQEISLDIQSLAGEGLVVFPGAGEPSLKVELDAYQVDYDDSNNVIIFADNVQDAIDEIDGYLQSLGGNSKVIHVRKLGSDAEDPDFRSVFSLDGNEYPVGADRLLVTINGILQSPEFCFVETSTTQIEFTEPLDPEDIVDVYILPGSLGGGNGGTTNLQSAYDNSPSNSKQIFASDGALLFTQTQSTGSALRLVSTTSSAPTLVADQSGTGEGARIKSVAESAASLLVQKDATSRNTIINTAIIERTTSHINGGLNGIGSSILTRLENTGAIGFSASRLITSASDASDSSENADFTIELVNDGIMQEKIKLTSDGKLGLNTSSPSSELHVEGDGYVSNEITSGGKIRAGVNAQDAALNIPVLSSDPLNLSNGDIWITDDGVTRQLNARMGGVTYSVTLT